MQETQTQTIISPEKLETQIPIVDYDMRIVQGLYPTKRTTVAIEEPEPIEKKPITKKRKGKKND